jgi:hypothetical protein
MRSAEHTECDGQDIESRWQSSATFQPLAADERERDRVSAEPVSGGPSAKLTEALRDLMSVR